MDGEISRIFIIIDVSINPTTFEICKQNIDSFKGDIFAAQLLENATYISKNGGYNSCAFEKEFFDDSIMKEAEDRLKYCEDTIIKLHIFTMEFLGIKK